MSYKSYKASPYCYQLREKQWSDVVNNSQSSQPHVLVILSLTYNLNKTKTRAMPRHVDNPTFSSNARDGGWSKFTSHPGGGPPPADKWSLPKGPTRVISGKRQCVSIGLFADWIVVAKSKENVNSEIRWCKWTRRSFHCRLFILDSGVYERSAIDYSSAQWHGEDQTLAAKKARYSGQWSMRHGNLCSLAAFPRLARSPCFERTQ